MRFASLQSRHVVALTYGVFCHGLFVVSVGLMIFHMYFGMSLGLGPFHGVAAFAANVFLLAQFPLVHSFLLSSKGRRRLRHFAPQAFAGDLATTTYVIIAALQILALFNLWSFSGIVWWRASGWALALILPLYAASWLLLGLAILNAGFGLQSGLLGWWAVFRNQRPQFPPLPTRGLFAVTRQPIYIAFTFTTWTVPTWTPDQLVVAIVLTAYCLIGPLFKEARFSQIHGQRFSDYQKTTPYWLPLPFWQRRKTAINHAMYDDEAERWWDGSVRWVRTLQGLVGPRFQFFDQVVDWKGKAVLDLGCAGGFMAEALARRGADVTAIDPAASAIAAAKAHAEKARLAIHYSVGSGEALPVDSRSQDVVVCVDVLEHVDDLAQVISEVARVLKPGGLFLFDTLNRNWLSAFVIVAMGERVLRIAPPGTHDPAKFIRPAELAALLSAQGFAEPVITGWGPQGLTRKLDFTFGTMPTTLIGYIGHARVKNQDISKIGNNA